MTVALNQSGSIERKESSGVWAAAGAVVILILVVGFFVVRHHQGEKRAMERLQFEKGQAIIRSIEAGTRAGMFRKRWGRVQLQVLLEEMARQPGVNAILLLAEDGKILGHSEREKVGDKLPFWELNTVSPGRLVGESRMQDGLSEYVVRGVFEPIFFREENRRHKHGMGHHKPGSFTGKDWYDRMFPGEPPKAMIMVVLSLEESEAALGKDLRKTIVISALLLALGCGGIASLYGAQSYRATRDTLKETRAMAREVIASLPVGLMVLGEKGEIRFINDAARKMAGLSEQTLEGGLAREVLGQVMEVVERSLEAGGGLHEKEIFLEMAEAKPLPVSLSASLITRDDGEVLGQVVIFRDLREVKSLEKELRHKETLAAIGDMAAGVAHEIRNPLSSIKGIATFFRVLMEEREEGRDAREAADVMIAEVDRLNRAVTELLTVAGPTRLALAPHDVGELVERALRLVEQEAESQGVSLHVERGQKPLWADLDGDRVTQSLLNLFLNGLQAMEHGGELRVRLDDLPDALQVSVQDTGCGMDEETLKSLFDPYFTTRADGTGLGLAIVHKIVKAHGGSLNVTSRPGEGSCFVMRFPKKIRS